MTDSRIVKQLGVRTIITMITLFTIIVATAAAFGHGGKHTGAFTHLQALQKAAQLYDKLIDNGKLDQSWENGLEKVTISNRQKNIKEEVVVVFHRLEGDPRAVYIFFNTDGEYAGSNFTGE